MPLKLTEFPVLQYIGELRNHDPDLSGTTRIKHIQYSCSLSHPKEVENFKLNFKRYLVVLISE